MREQDAPAVAHLFAARFRSTRSVDVEVVARRLVRAYFEHPWPDPDIGPWLLEAEHGRVIGFLGVTPRHFRWQGRTLRAAMIGNLMVDAEHPDAGGSSRIISAFLEGPQDLAISDSALDITRKISNRFRGATIRLLSQSWRLGLQQATTVVEGLVRNRRDPASRALRRLAVALDDLGREVGRGPWRLPTSECQVVPLPVARFAELLTEHSADQPESIVPIYDAASLAWVLHTPRGGEHGLRMREVKNAAGHTLGWFVHYVERDAELIHIGSVLGAGQRVFDCAMLDAAAAGACAMTGRIVPGLMREMSIRGARYATRDWTILHTRSPEIVAAFHAGAVNLQPMDGERWSMRFVDVADA